MRHGTVFLLCFAIASVASADDIKHRWVCVDNGANRLIHVDQNDTSKNWSTTIPGGSRDLQLLGDGKLLVSHGNGAAEYRLADGERLPWVVDRYRNIQTACRLRDSNTLLATVSGTLYEVDPGGNEIGKVQIAVTGLNMRLMRVLPSGNLLIGCAEPKAVIEVSRDGEVVKSLPLPDKGYVATRLDDGRTVATSGGEARIVILDNDGNILSYVGGRTDHPQLGLDFCSGWERLPSGHYVMANWLGHGKQGTGPHLIEFSTDNKVVWTWKDHEMARQVTNVLMLDGECPDRTCERLAEPVDRVDAPAISSTARLNSLLIDPSNE